MIQQMGRQDATNRTPLRSGSFCRLRVRRWLLCFHFSPNFVIQTTSQQLKMGNHTSNDSILLPVLEGSATYGLSRGKK
jgi:hypothetical protein